MTLIAINNRTDKTITRQGERLISIYGNIFRMITACKFLENFDRIRDESRNTLCVFRKIDS